MFIKPENFQARCLRITRLNPKILEYEFEVLEHDFNFKAGQFVMMNFDSLIDEQKKLSRAYSISTGPKPNRFELCVEIVPGGQAGAYFSAMQEGQVVDFKGPFGVCCLPDHAGDELVMIATATGIAPIKSILEDLVARKDMRKVTVYFGLRSEADMFYETQISDLLSEFPESKFILTLSQPTNSRSVNKWRVTAHVLEAGFHDNMEIYICGNGNMVRDIRSHAIIEGVDKKKIHLEIFDS